MAFLKPNAGAALLRGSAPRWAAWCVVVAFFAAHVSAARAEAAAISAENQIKAVFLFNFTQFVKWPARTFADAQAPIVIGVLGEDPFGPYLDGVVQNEKIGGRPIVVRRYRRVEDLAECHILFISRSESARLEQICAQLNKSWSILTVGDSENFSRQGGMVRFATEGGKTRLRINIAAAKAAELTLSSKLLAHAVIVVSGKN
ncbi:MAG: YfiR family protein [Undibacterium sp.]|nr:YfiR family protein [Opitutaceae bacterium]